MPCLCRVCLVCVAYICACVAYICAYVAYACACVAYACACLAYTCACVSVFVCVHECLCSTKDVKRSHNITVMIIFPAPPQKT